MSHWRSSDFLLGLLVALAVWAVWEGYVLNHRPETRGCGGDFPQFYAAGKIVSQGEADRLYDQPYFRHLQDSLRDDPLRSLYPPTMGLLMAPLGRLPYNAALAAWWAIQAICILATGAIFYRTTPLSRPRRINMLVALAALLPLWIAVGIGHVAPLLLLVLAGGLTLHKQGKRCWAGLALSLLALKPQLAAGLLLWMLLRRDLRTLAGLAAGLIFQALAVAACLGATVWLDYLHALPVISAITRGYRYSPLFEQSFAGMARNLCWAAGPAQWQVPAMRMAYVPHGRRGRSPALPRRLGAAALGSRCRGSPDRKLRVCLRRAVHDDLPALLPRLRPGPPGRAACDALVVAGMAVGCGPTGRKYGIRGKPVLPTRFQPEWIDGPGDDVCFSENRAGSCDLDLIRKIVEGGDPLRGKSITGGVLMSHWRLSDWTLAFLSVLTMLAAWEGFMVGNCPANHGCGGCFSQFYVAGTIIHRGEAERLYDQPYFRDLQESMRR